MSLDRLQKKKAARTPPAPKAVESGDPAMKKLIAKSAKRSHPDKRDMERILELAFVDMMTPDESGEFSQAIVLARAYERGFKLFQEQSSAVAAYLTEAGGFFPIGVGWGKTLISLMVAERAWQKGIKKMILHIEPGCLGQLVKTDIPYGRRVTNISVPFIVLGGRSKKERAAIVESGRKGCYIMPYSQLSVEDTMDMLEAIDPDLVIADECHNLKDRKTARTKRWMAMMNYRERELVAMSGTITSKTIEDYRHLIDLALKDASPLPRSAAMAHGWGAVLDSGSVISDTNQSGPMEPLVGWANERKIEQRRVEPDPEKRKAIRHLRMTISDIREAYTMRMHSVPGVVATSDAEIGASISIENLNPKGKPWSDDGPFWNQREGWAELSGHMDRVKEDWKTPNGDEIDHAIHTFKWMTELGSGFYNELVWPTVEQLQKHCDKNERQAEHAIDDAREAHALQQHYNKACRSFFETSPPGLDTPLSLLRVLNHNPDSLPSDIVLAYLVWRDKVKAIEEQHGFLVERLSNSIRVCDFKVMRGVEWAKHAMDKHGSGILWAQNIEMGKWMVDELEKAGVPTVACPAGANQQIIDLFNPENGTADKIAVASIRAHATGKNLQRAASQLVLQWPRDAKIAEQMLGRVHRNGIEKFSDHVTINTMNVLPYDYVLFGSCLVDATYQHQTGSRRKMVYSTYNPMPRMFTPEFLKARGASTQTLTRDQKTMLEDKFGDDWEDQL